MSKQPQEWTCEHKDSYYWKSRRPFYCLVFLLPALVFFHFGAIHWGTDLLVPKYFSNAMRYVGVSGIIFPAAAVAVVLLSQHYFQKFEWKISPMVLLGMLVESLAWTLPLVAIGYVFGRMGASVTVVSESENLWRLSVKAVGAGIYEEFAFRLVLIGVLMFLLEDLLKLAKNPSVVISIVVSACLFSIAHYIIPGKSFSSAYAIRNLVFLAMAGLIWGLAYANRGLGIAAGSHIAWNLFVLVDY